MLEDITSEASSSSRDQDNVLIACARPKCCRARGEVGRVLLSKTDKIFSGVGSVSSARAMEDTQDRFGECRDRRCLVDDANRDELSGGGRGLAHCAKEGVSDPGSLKARRRQNGLVRESLIAERIIKVIYLSQPFLKKSVSSGMDFLSTLSTTVRRKVRVLSSSHAAGAATSLCAVSSTAA